MKPNKRVPAHNGIQVLFSIFLAVFLLKLNFLHGQSSKGSEGKGAVIVVTISGPVLIKRSDDGDSEPMKVGMVLGEGCLMESNDGGKATLLLSNGTLLTLKPKTRMKVGIFQQEPFEADGKKVSDLEAEPSVSKIKLDLEWGDLVIKTKKLNKQSSFDISTSSGTAGVRGTEFQIAQQPSQNMQLDVTESTVSFSSPGGQSIPVSEGSGLDVSQSGAITSRPVNPVVAQSIAVTNEAATQASADVSLDSVSDAMQEATSIAAEDASAEGDGDSEDGSDAEENEATEEGEAEDGQTEDSDTGGDNEGETGEMEESSSSSETDAGGSENNEAESASAEQTGGSSEDSSSSSQAVQTSMVEVEVDIDEMIESNPDTKQARETGEVAESGVASQLAEMQLDGEQIVRFYSFSAEIRSSMLDEDAEILGRLLDLTGFESEQAEIYFSYSEELRSLLTTSSDEVLLSFLDRTLDETILLSVLNEENLDSSDPSLVPSEKSITSIESQVLALADRLRESGNSEIMEEIIELSGGDWTEEWIEVAEVADELSGTLLLGGNWDQISLVSGEDAFSNPFFDLVTSTYGDFSWTLSEQSTPIVIGATQLSLDEGFYDLSEVLNQSEILLLAASENLSFSSSIEFTSESSENRVIIVSGGSMDFESGSSLKNILGDLAVVSRESMIMENATLEAGRELGIQSTRDLDLNEVSVGAGTFARIRAARDLNVNGLQIAQDLPSLILEATTLRLRNVDFPSATSVRLNSLKGPLDGKYPNFGEVSTAQQVGRVNFIENVSSGGNLLMDRSTFDQFGGNLQIGKLASP